ncbi:MAG: hypothetical protein WCL39_05875 [Armatimonadota bacterium]
MTKSYRFLSLVFIICLSVFVGASLPVVAEGIAFSRNGWIFHIPAVGQSAVKMTLGDSPAMSPDGRKIAYCVNGSSAARAAIAVLNISTKKSALILKPGAIVTDVIWSPVDNQLAFITSTDAGKSQLQTMRSDGSARRKIISDGTSSVGFMFSPTWAADGQSITFHDNEILYRVSLSGSILSTTSTATIAGKKSSISSTDRFVFSPRSAQRLAFTQFVPGSAFSNKVTGEPNTALFIYDLGSKTRTRLTPVDLVAFSPVWSRDGRYLFFCGYRDKQYKEAYPFRIYRIGADGKGLQELGKGEDPSL